MSEYVNYDGLKRYDELIKNVISVKTWIGSCSTAAGTAAKVISVESGFKLLKGVRIGVKFTNSNTASNVTLNVNSTGAKSIYYNNAVYTGTSNMICGYANRYVFYVYDGTNWVWDGYSNHDVPTVNNATLTIQKNGTTVKTFTANASSNVTANITVPTKVSELTNDSGYTTNTGTVTSVKVGTTSYSPSSGVISLPAYPTSLPANGGTASNVSGTVAIGNGGTGATTAADARTNLGLGTLATKSSLTASDIPSITKSKISDFPSSMPASDVSAWAKAANKPSYSYSEIEYTVNAATSAGGTVSLNGAVPLHVITLTGNVSALTLSANPPAGHSCHIILTSTAERTVAIAHDATNRVCPEAEDVSLTIKANGYVEIDFLNVNGKIYVRGI